MKKTLSINRYEKEKDKFINEISDNPKISASLDKEIDLMDIEGNDIYNETE